MNNELVEKKYPSIVISSVKGETFISCDHIQDNNNFDASNIQEVLTDLKLYLATIAFADYEILYCKIFTLDSSIYNKIVSRFEPIIHSDKVFQIFQPSVQSKTQILIRVFDKKVLKKNNIKMYFNRFDSDGSNIREETFKNFSKLLSFTEKENLSILNNVVRSWIYVNDIDKKYQDVVEERKIFFDQNGLNSDSRYLASTGIGSFINSGTESNIDVLSFGEINSRDLTVMKNYEIMPDTLSYNVHFERGIVVSLKDRKHMYLSGTASIDKNGEVLFIGNPKKQAEAALFNCKSLLEKYDSSLSNLTHLIIYIRNPEDYKVVYDVIFSSLPSIPLIFLHGPVCRPEWLVELEGMAIH